MKNYKEYLREDGFFIVKNFFSDLDKKNIVENWGLSKEMNSGSEDRFKSNMTEYFHNLYRHPLLIDLFSQILSPNIALYFYRLMAKDSSWSGEVPPHQEAPYFHGGLSKLMCFIPISRMYKENGGLYFLRGSHKYGFLGRVNDHNIDLGYFPDLEKVYADVDLGDLIVHDFLLWHGSDAASKIEERPLYHCVYQPASDGSYWAKPTLVCGAWETKNFLGFREGVNGRDNQTILISQPETLVKKLDSSIFIHEGGFCYLVELEDKLISDEDGCSQLKLYEDGVLLAGKKPHVEIRSNGNGSYSHWGSKVYFSSTDNSDPRFNGRAYTISL